VRRLGSLSTLAVLAGPVPVTARVPGRAEPRPGISVSINRFEPAHIAAKAAKPSPADETVNITVRRPWAGEVGVCRRAPRRKNHQGQVHRGVTMGPTVVSALRGTKTVHSERPA
jgi:hypothetical protein